jgi:hypothetical protein
MRTWRKFLNALAQSPRGYLADGRTLGLGLATAMEKTRQDTSDVEEFLRRGSSDERQSISS